MGRQNIAKDVKMSIITVAVFRVQSSNLNFLRLHDYTALHYGGAQLF